jgi:hypothetical protein
MMRFLLALLLLAITATAHAEPLPRYVPDRDVAITYRSTGTESALPPSITLRYFAVADRIRLDSNQGAYLLLDRAAERVEMVLPAAKLAMELPSGAGIVQGFILGDRLQFHRTGSATVLGRACTIYDVSVEKVHATACLTSDGLLLRGEGTDPAGRHASIEATQIAFTPQPPGLFSPPDTYRYLAQPR